MLKDDFPDISISKIRYLEDQGLLAPRRTQGGYRLFSEDDLERLETILRLQRDEFLPLARHPPGACLAAARDRKRRRAGLTARNSRARPRPSSASAPGIDARLARELEEFGLLAPRTEGRREALRGARCRHRACVRPARSVRDRACATSAASGPPPTARPGLIEQVVGPSLRARNPERRRAGHGGPGGSRRARAGPQSAPLLARASPACVNMIR